MQSLRRVDILTLHWEWKGKCTLSTASISLLCWSVEGNRKCLCATSFPGSLLFPPLGCNLKPRVSPGPLSAVDRREKLWDNRISLNILWIFFYWLVAETTTNQKIQRILKEIPLSQSFSRRSTTDTEPEKLWVRDCLERERQEEERPWEQGCTFSTSSL